MKPVRARPRIRLVLLGDLEEYSVHEACLGAAAYAAARPDLDFDPWATYRGRSLPTLADLNRADGALLSEASLRLIRGRRHPVTVPHVYYLANDRHANAPAVELDERAIGRLAAEHLASRGYRYLAFFGCATMPWSQLRGDGFRAAAAALQRPVQDYDFPANTLPVYRSARWRQPEQGLHHALRSLPQPCGIFAANDVTACYVIQEARLLGLRIPEQLGIIGADDDPIPNAAAGLGISTVQLPFREAGRRAAALLEQRLRGKKTSRRVVLPPVRVIVRASTNTFMVDDSLVRQAQTYIEEHRAEGLRVAQVVRALHTTAVTLEAHFTRHLKLAPAAYIRQRRLEHAKDLLRAGELTVQQVSESCHFHDCSYFCQVFKEATGLTPGRFRMG